MVTFEGYLRHASKIGGWFDLRVLKWLSAVDDLHQRLGVTGNLLEIGVHCGRSFVPIYLMAREGERAIAIDCFDESVSGMPHGDKRLLTYHLKAVAGDTGRLVLIEADSRGLAAGDIRRRAPGPLRLAHIDGCHDAGAALHDFSLCADLLGNEGVILLDDVFNPCWPGVHEAAAAILADRRWSPLAVGYNKLLLCRRPLRQPYAAALPPPSKRETWYDAEVLIYQ